MRLLIKGGRVVDPASGMDQTSDLLIENGRILQLGSDLDSPDVQTVSASGLVVAPGLVDMHVHLREPGFEEKETVATGCAAAARGGVTTLVAMPNTRPTTDCPELIRLVREKAVSTGIHVFPAGAVTQGQKGEVLTDFTALHAAGAPAVTDDGVPVQNLALLRQALQTAKNLGIPLLDHCEDRDMVRNYAVNEGAVSEKLGLPGRPAIAEELQVMRDAMLAEETGAHVHICHISSGKAVDIVRRAKARGISITCETCPQYFTLTEEEILRQGTMARVNPPLRTIEDRQAILDGLVDGTIDAIVTDHAPHCQWEKEKPLPEAPSGMVGLETSLALALTGLYHTGLLPLSRVLGLMSSSPAAILGLEKGRIAEGSDGDLVIFDPDEEWTIDRNEFVSKGRNTPFHGFTVRGKVKYTISEGTVIYRED
ncbi:MAG TPA: dihydroorotase [Candidatus Enterenecus stercoripullorum]|nr:dihydroorotase [Candidatus Enterenecus stercoripullorum]